jgi:hypothetical protein
MRVRCDCDFIAAQSQLETFHRLYSFHSIRKQWHPSQAVFTHRSVIRIYAIAVAIGN